MIKKFLAIFGFYSVISLQSIALAADIVIDSPVFGQNLSGDNNVTINSGGDVSSSAVNTPALSADQNINLVINADSNQGVRNTIGGNAIKTTGTTNIVLNSGVISTNSQNGGSGSNSSTIDLRPFSGDVAIDIKAGSQISNSLTGSGTSAISYMKDAVSDSTNFLLNNAGTISSQSTSGVVVFNNGYSNYNAIINNSGLIRSLATNGNSIVVGGGFAGINNNSNGTITGAIGLGTNADSFINNDGGAISGSIFFGNSNQKLDIKNGGSVFGGVNRAGIVTIDSTSTLSLSNLSASSSLLASINGSSAGVGKVFINSGQSIKTSTDIGSINSLESVTLLSNSTLDIATNNNSISATDINFSAGSVLNVGTGSVNGNINALTNGVGAVNFAKSINITQNIGSQSSKILSLSIASNQKLTLTNAEINLKSKINLGANSDVDIKGGRIEGSIIRSASSGASVNSINIDKDSTIYSKDQDSVMIGVLPNSFNFATTLNINNQGNIIRERDPFDDINKPIINFTATSLSSFLNITNSGLISGGAGNTIIVEKGTLRLNNINGGRIVGDIDAGDNDSSFINVSDNSSIDGNIIFGKPGQSLNINNSSFVSGAILSQGNVLVGDNSFLKINNLNDFVLEAKINGLSDGVGSVVINSGQAITTNTDIGSITKLALVSLSENALLDLSSNNNSLNATTIALSSGSTLNVGSGAISGNIQSATAGNFGTINFFDNITLNQNLGELGFGIANINLASDKILNTNGHNIVGNIISLGSNAVLNNDATIFGNVILDQNATLNLSNNSMPTSINGLNAGLGNVNIASGTSEISSVGQTNSIANFNVANNSRANLNDNIAASNINLSGILDLRGASGNSIFGNLNVANNAILILNNQSHNVSGNLNLDSGSTLSVNVLSPTQASKIAVSGAANVDPNTNLAVSLVGSTAIGSQYPIIEGGAGSNINQIADSQIKVDGGTNQVGIFNFTTLASGNDLILRVTGLNPIATINPDQLDIQNNTLSNINSVLNISSSRLGSLRGVASGDASQNKHLWGQTFGTNVRQGNIGNVQGYNANTAGLIFGLDREFANDITAGLSFGYSNSNIKSKSADQRIDLDTYQITLYGSYDLGKYFINSLAAIGFNQYSSNRSIVGSGLVASADYSGQTYMARVEGGANYNLANNLIFTPKLALTAAKNQISSYSESGATGFNFNVDKTSINFLEARAGAEIGKEFVVNKTNRIRPKFQASYGYDFAGNRQTTNINFVGQSTSFQSSGANVARASLRVGSGVELMKSDDLKLNLDYNFETKKNYQAHTGLIKATYNF